MKTIETVKGLKSEIKEGQISALGNVWTYSVDSVKISRELAMELLKHYPTK